MKNRIRGCMIAGAAGDALGYAVEFISRNTILNNYGNDGIRVFDLDDNGKALISDDTQMSLFTANGILWGNTCTHLRGMMGNIQDYVQYAYIDWFYTQTEYKNKDNTYCTWLRNMKEMASLRAPGNTCMDACYNLLNNTEVKNNSKGCGGIMRVAPIALFAAAEKNRGVDYLSESETAYTGSEIARITHKHPLAFLPSAMLSELILKLITMDIADIKEHISDIILSTIPTMRALYPGEFEKDKDYLANLTEMAVSLAANDKFDADNIRTLGEGWVGEEAWAIAVYCAVRHIDSVEEAIIASVNHDGDSDSTGAVTGNIMGAIYGYEYLKERNIFCPEGKHLEDTLELTNIIIALADDLYQGCIINEFSTTDTPEKKQWFERYCEMKPAGIV